MKIKRWSVIVACVVLVAMTFVTLGMLYLLHTNDLGLTEFDLIVGGHPLVDALRASARAAADSFLATRKNELADPSDGAYELAVDYSKSSEIRSLGYRSSFYFYCWDIYLPYSLRTQSGKTATVVVHLSDGTQGHNHDPQKFRVIDVTLLDHQGRSTKTVNGI
jgi:hypothetical protein